MAEIKLNTELMTNMEIQEQMSSRSGIAAYLVKSTKSDNLYVLKHISIPETQKQVDALILTGAAADTAAAHAYYEQVVTDYKTELEKLEELSKSPNLSSFRSYEIKPKEEGVGFDIYLLAEHRTTLETYLAEHSLSQSDAVNMALDLCNALCELREAGLIHRDVKPANIYLNSQGHFMLGDLGVAPMDGLKYCSMPELMISTYSAPELFELMAAVNETIDLYAVGLILYRIYNGGHAPFEDEKTSVKAADRLRITGQELPTPMFADYEMAEIIRKACAFKPEDRYQSPDEMKQAFVDYMVRNQVGDTPIAPPIVADDISVDEDAVTEEIEPVQFATTDELDDTFKESFSPDNDMLNALIESVHKDIEKDYTARNDQDIDALSRIVQKPRKKKKFTKWFPTALLILLLLAVIVTAIWFFFIRKDTLTIASVEVLDRGVDYISVNLVTTEDPEQFEVVCTDNRTTNLTQSYKPGSPNTFTGLNPGVQYTITIRGFEDERIAGAVDSKVSTKIATEILNSSVTRETASTIEITFNMQGAEPDEWLVAYGPVGKTKTTKTFTGHSVIIAGLEPDTEYEMTLLDSGDAHLTGATTLTGRTLPSVTLLYDTVKAEMENSKATITWEYVGDAPTSWSITTSGSKGYTDTRTVTTNELILENLVAGETYSLSISCDNMIGSGNINFTVDAYSIAKISEKYLENGDVEISWTCQAEAEDVEWVVVYSLEENDMFSFRETTTEQSVVLTSLFPGSVYNIEIKEAKDEKVGGNNKTTITTPAAESYTGHNFSTAYPVMYRRPDKEEWSLNDLAVTSDTFTASERIAFACVANSLSTQNSDTVKTLLLVKNEAGKIVDCYTNAGDADGGSNWKDMWVNNTYIGELHRTPSEPGRYTLELYFNNKRVRMTDDFSFTIKE